MNGTTDNSAPRDPTGILIAAGILPSLYLFAAITIVVDCVNRKEFFASLPGWIVTLPSSLAAGYILPHTGEMSALLISAVSNACILFAVCYVAIGTCVSLWPSRRLKDGH